MRKRLSQLHNFFTKNSNLIIDKTREQKSVGAHSLRRRFAQNRYDLYISQGCSDEKAMSKVCCDLGHSGSYKTKKDGSISFKRADITDVYVNRRVST